MSDHEQLSRLLSEDLSIDEANALRSRIDAEPDLAAAWDAMQSLVADLGDLPELRPPAELDAQVVDGSPPVRRAANASRWIPWVAAAAAIALWLMPSPTPDLVLMEGSQWVDGQARVYAADAWVDVDGRAEISVEPPVAGARVTGRDQEDPMNRSSIAAGLAGALVTVAVYEGTAVLRAEAHDPVVVTAGETRAIGGARSAAVAGRAVAQAGVVPEHETAEQTIARLSEEIAQLQETLAQAEFSAAVTRGQLVAHQGEVSEWPDGVPDAFTPTQFEDEVRRRFADVEGAEVTRVDCSEYPCIAVVRSHATGDDWADALEGVPGEMAHDAFGDKVALSVNRSAFRSNDNEARYILFSAMGGKADQGVADRTKYRVNGIVDELGQELDDLSDHDEDEVIR